MTTYELGSSLEKLLSKLKQNRENVPLDILKTYYKVPYEELIAQVNQTATAFVKSIVTGQLLINPDVSMNEQADVVNQTIQDSGMIKQISHCMSQTYDVTLIHLMALELRKKVEAALYPYISRKNCLVADLDDIEKEPIIYNTLTKQVYENDHWIDRELDLDGKLLISNQKKKNPKIISNIYHSMIFFIPLNLQQQTQKVICFTILRFININNFYSKLNYFTYNTHFLQFYIFHSPNEVHMYYSRQ